MNAQLASKFVASLRKVGLDYDSVSGIFLAAYAKETKRAANEDAAISAAVARTVQEVAKIRPARDTTLRADTRTPSERFLASLTPSERHAVANLPSKEEQQAGLRARFMAEVMEKAVNRHNHNIIKSDVLRAIASSYKRMGLENTRVTGEDVGQSQAFAADPPASTEEVLEQVRTKGLHYGGR